MDLGHDFGQADRFGKSHWQELAGLSLLSVAGVGAARKKLAGDVGACMAESSADSCIKNFGVHSDHLLRGAAPDKAGLQYLADRGVTQIVDFRLPGPRAFLERRSAEQLGMKYYNMPVVRASRSQVERFHNLVNQPGEITFGHCRWGKDRTGFMFGTQRRIEGLSAQDTLAEMQDYGFRSWLFNMKSFIKKADTKLAAITTPPAAKANLG